ncbi:MAG: phosphonate C-P lyase system protein PhnH [Clostridia bacterium]|nr:phosphonate C-P lyase system protein PhnH [Clostridia bacterium]
MVHYAIKESTFNEVFDSQKNFRVLMDGMSRPGKVFKLHEHDFDKFPAGFNPWVLVVLKTLGDNNVTYSLVGNGNEEWKKYIEINTGMTSEEAVHADYAILDGKTFTDCFSSIHPGSLEFPEDSSTAVITVDLIAENLLNKDYKELAILYMSGPGIKDVNSVGIAGLDKKYVTSILQMNENFPVGIDAIFVDRIGHITCMSRTTKAEVK